MGYSALIITVLLLLLISKRRPAKATQGSFIAPPISNDLSSTITVGAYNIHRTRGTDGRRDLNRIAGMLSKCDIAGLSELEGGTPFILENQLHKLAKKLNLAGVFACNQMRWGFENRGNGALSRFPINHWAVTPLADTVGNHPRCLLQMECQIQGQPVTVFVTHLARRTDQESQLKAVLDKFTQYDKAILMGDLNMVGDFPMLKQVLQAGQVIDAHQQIPDSDKREKIDWILVRGVSVKNAGVIHSPASDHPFYWADIALP
ncbi:MAG: endonuclease/exonuclease/phosphatase family metal-dependent hydrolase [Saprospiraceae bacterium]|jgi:endonuclease/exonuclease/phosphatase family metal-dependent hydrolase